MGAGPAGCAAAYDLAAAGRSVLLLDKAAFPRAKACAGGLTSKAVQALRYRIDPVVRRWERAVVLEGPSRSATLRRRKPVCAMTVRAELDSYCLEQTLARGARFQRIAGIAGLVQGAEAVTVRLVPGAELPSHPKAAPDAAVCEAVSASAHALRARFVLGADGVHSRVRALLGSAPWFRTGFAVEANVPYRRGSENGETYPLTFDFAPVVGGYGWLFPRDTHVNVGLYVGASPKDGQPGSVNKAALERYTEARCGAGRTCGVVVGQFLGLGAAAYRPAAGTRVLLAGDAAGFVDPLTGEGIYGAIRSGQAAAAAMLGALSGSSDAERGVSLPERFLEAARELQEDLGVAEHAAERFHAEPARAWAMLRVPGLGRFALEVYAEGLRLGGLLRAARFAGRCASGLQRMRAPVFGQRS